jgi:signal transduction histidine kinase
MNPTFTALLESFRTTRFLSLCGITLVGLALLRFMLRCKSLAQRMRDRAEERANERIRIARDLHDTLLQAFPGLMLSIHAAVQAVPKETHARELLERALVKADSLFREGRDRVSRLRSDRPEGVSLPEALRALGEELDSDHSSRFEVRITRDELEIESHVKDELFLIAREAITNSFRHAEATTVGVRLEYGKHALSMICYDDGCGIAAETIESAPRLHYGMLGMRERSHRIGATYFFESAPGEGTRVTALIGASRAYVQVGWFTGVLRSFRDANSTEA